jgi:hypothetical protein
MPQSEKHDSGFSYLALTLGSALVWAVLSVVGIRIIRHFPASTGARIAGVALGMLGFISWQLTVFLLVRKRDEFTQRLYLIASGMAFAVTGFFIISCDLLQRAGFIDYVSLMNIWMVMMGSWAVAVAATEWYYCR